MRSGTYEKLAAYWGYVETKQLLEDGFTNRQIASFAEEGFLEKICHGHYWVQKETCEKPREYKAIEVCLSDPKAVICADSACFYLGLIQEEPAVLSVATSRKDRSVIKMNFLIKRHYISEDVFFEASHEISTDLGRYQIFDIYKNVCDCIRFRKDIDPYIFELIIDSYRAQEERQKERMLEYAKRLRMFHEVQRYFKS